MQGCQDGKMQVRVIRRLGKTFSARVEVIWSEDIQQIFECRGEIELISVGSPLASARGVVSWLRQCRLGLWGDDCWLSDS
jgi:hypothetical protein